MKLGIVSDTHDNLEKARAAVKFFNSENIGNVIHCGDIVSPFTAGIFDSNFDFHYVRGNNDGEWNLKQVIQEFGNFYNNIAELQIDGKNFAVYHGTEGEIVEALVESGNYDYVLRGHTHKRKHEEHENTVEINPGGIQLPDQDEKFSVAILDTDTGEVNFHNYSQIK